MDIKILVKEMDILLKGNYFFKRGESHIITY
jgi:hypothetical protein